ncbi:MAG: phosphotransferase [Pseudomonadota bacterium]
MSNRNPTAFLRAHGWENAARSNIAGDASNRRYDRLTRSDGRRAILMDAPPDMGEDVRPFIAITDLLRAQNLSAPRIFGADTEAGFLLLEDLGDNLFASAIAADPSLEQPLYAAATDVLIHMHCAPPPKLPAYDAVTMTPLAGLAFEWYGSGALSRSLTEPQLAFQVACHAALEPLDTQLTALIQRDYHAENLLWLPDREGIARVGLLDYQDAMRGHPAYDLVSILQDARRDITPDIAQEMITRYVTQTDTDHDTFETAYALLGMQRSMRILGVFARLSLAFGKPQYVDLIPRVWGHLTTNLQHPALATLSPLITDILPEPSADVLNTLRDKCASMAL